MQNVTIIKLDSIRAQSETQMETQEHKRIQQQKRLLRTLQPNMLLLHRQ